MIAVLEEGPATRKFKGEGDLLVLNALFKGDVTGLVLALATCIPPVLSYPSKLDRPCAIPETKGNPSPLHEGRLDLRTRSGLFVVSTLDGETNTTGNPSGSL